MLMLMTLNKVDSMVFLFKTSLLGFFWGGEYGLAD
jgi:hypothetical protein